MTEHLRRKRYVEDIPDIESRADLISRCAIDEIDKKILTMRYAKKKDFGYIADELGLSYAAVIKRHKKALAVLQKLAVERTKMI